MDDFEDQAPAPEHVELTLLATDKHGKYVLPFAVVRIGDQWINVETDRPIARDVRIVGWKLREPPPGLGD